MRIQGRGGRGGEDDARHRRPVHTSTVAAPARHVMGLLVWALTAALMGLAALPCSVAAAAAVPLPFPLPDRVVRGQDSAPLVIWPRAFRMLDASDQPTRTVALALERYWALTFPHDLERRPMDVEETNAPMASAANYNGTSFTRRRLRADRFPPPPKAADDKDDVVVLRGLRVIVADPSEAAPQLETDESYMLEIPLPPSSFLCLVVATLRARTVHGALRGLESFSQLVVFDWASSHRTPAVHRYLLPAGAPLLISDAPRFPWRGLLVDTGRHFQPVAHIKALLESMAYAKLNVLHWHLVDSEAFPFESRAYPKLWEGAYSPDERYLQAEVADIVEFARLRGIRVVPEFDVPGHAASWCKGYPEICPSPTCLQPLDPSNNATLRLIDGLLREVTAQGSPPGAGLFPDALIHLGGDEVFTGCWSDTPHIAEWMEAQGNWTVQDTYKAFVDFAARSALQAQRSPMQWVEVFDAFGAALHPQTVVHVWKEKATAQRIVAAGYRSVLSDNDVWYLDHLDTPWQAVYDNEPCEGINDPRQRALILGGEACMWGETVDPSDLLPTVWPRAAALAERLWSSAVAGTRSNSSAMPNGRPNDVHDRLRRFRCLLLQRGVGAAPLENGRAREAPPLPGSCYFQRA